MRYLVPLQENAGPSSRVSYHFGKAPFFAIIDSQDGSLRFEIRPNPAYSWEHGRGACGVMDLVGVFRADALVVKHVGVRAAQRLMDVGIPVYETSSDVLSGVLDEIRNGSLRPFDLAERARGPCTGRGFGMREAAFYPPPAPGPWPPPAPGAPPPPPMLPMARRPAGGPKLAGKLRVAFSTNGHAGLDDTIADRFARCPTFTIVDVEDGRVLNVDIRDNPFIMHPHGAGFAVAQFLANMGVSAVVAARFGPNAWQALASLGISIHVAPPGTKVRDALRSLTG